jgi:hypothetical protein
LLSLCHDFVLHSGDETFYLPNIADTMYIQ